MKLRRAWFTRHLSKTMSELFLEVVVEAILGAKENNATLGDYGQG